jgi:hypothetical protein
MSTLYRSTTPADEQPLAKTVTALDNDTASLLRLSRT